MHSRLRSATAGSDANAVDIRVGAQRPIYRVVSWAEESMTLEALARNCAQRWPEKVGGTTSISASCRILCIGPAEWLAIGGESAPSISDVPCVIGVELTEGLAHVELVGEAVEELLTCVCGLDVHPAAFAPNSCARTQLAGIRVILDRHGPEEFACYLSRSYLSYLLAALHESARGLMNVRFR